MGNLKENGYEKYDMMHSLHYDGIEEDYSEILNYFENLPEDDYAPGLNRYRRYSRALVLPSSGGIEWLPTVKRNGTEYAAYFQGKFNPEHSGSYREFHSIDENIRNNRLLREIIMANYHETFWKEEEKIMPIHVGVHFVKLLVSQDAEKAVSSPDCLHQDGEPFTFAHLVKRENVKGGTNAIGIPAARGSRPEDVSREDIHEIFELENPLESYGVYDSKVSHYVSPVEKGDGPEDTGVRSIILIDYQQTVVADMDE
ncbi:2OG-Fe dioxygenase family protein [Salinicoccus carnicancri]|uniref:2OG-Fe dioxygenase family protein n=1 Tax=Salinicoccus carnicancri TaxID=558170 RepID=UPI0002EE4F51|nr:2OG-Fe dioxygenase family protein [Salinicoccus carnicancri]